MNIALSRQSSLVQKKILRHYKLTDQARLGVTNIR